MNSDDARFILRALRNGDNRSSTDPLFKEALEQAQRDPALLQWLGRERAFDEMVSSKIETIAPPAGLRESILIGARASKPGRRWWFSPVFLAAAAAVVAAVGIPLAVRDRGHEIVAPVAQADEFARFAMENLVRGPHEHVTVPGVVELETALAAFSGRLRSTGLDLSDAALRTAGCQSFTFAGREVFEVCFNRGGNWLHLYVMRSDDAAGSSADAANPRIVELEGVAVATWAAAGQRYALVSRAGRAPFQELI